MSIMVSCTGALNTNNYQNLKLDEKDTNDQYSYKGDIGSLRDELEASDDPDKEGKLWVVLAAGSWGWANYRHQADVCHAYQIVKQHGIPDDRIVVFMKDDIANNPENPHPGVILNQPNGTNVYEGVPKDYVGNNLTPLNFINVLSGKTMNVGSGKTLNTGPKDRIFVYFADHGGPGLSQFGNSSHGMLYATNLTDTLNAMHKAKKYSEMVLYWESCNSGSMFLNLSTDINVYALSAANATQSSFACYCAPMFWGKTNVHCFGDCFSIHWMEDADDENLKNETLLIQFWITRHETDMNHYRKYEISHVEQWGSVAKMNNEKMSKYLTSNKKESYVHYQHPTSFNGDNARGMAIPQSEIALEMLKMEYKIAQSDEEKSVAGGKLQELKNNREMFHGKIREIMQTVVRVGKETGSLNKGQEKILADNDDNVVLSRPQYESCFYPLIQTFQERCFNFTCNDYVIYQMKKFLPLCKADVQQDLIMNAMKKHCNYQTPFCGID